MRTTKGGRTMNPTDAFRKEQRKKEIKKNKNERKKIREVGILKKDPESLRDQISRLDTMKAEGALDKVRKHKKRQLEDTLNLVLKKRREYEEKARERGEEPVMFSHLAGPKKPAPEPMREPRPEDSVYYHPTLNPSGQPPPGKAPMYRTPGGAAAGKSIFGRRTLSVSGASDASQAKGAGADEEEEDDEEDDEDDEEEEEYSGEDGEGGEEDGDAAGALPLPPPPPPPPLPSSSATPLPLPVPVPPPPPAPKGPAPPGLEPSPDQPTVLPPVTAGASGVGGVAAGAGGVLRPPPPPPRPPLPPPTTSPAASSAFPHTSAPPGGVRLVPPPPPPRPSQMPEMPPPGTQGLDEGGDGGMAPPGASVQDWASTHSMAAEVADSTARDASDSEEDAPPGLPSPSPRRVPPPPPPRPVVPPPPPPRPSLPPALSDPSSIPPPRFPPPPGPPPQMPPPHMRPPPGPPPQFGGPMPPMGSQPPLPYPTGVGFPPMGHPPHMRPPLGLPPGMRPPPGPPPGVGPNAGGVHVTEGEQKGGAKQTPSYVKSAAPMVVKRPLAQNTPELTAMVPASVRVRRETIVKPKPKSLVASSTSGIVGPVKPKVETKQEETLDDSYSAFFEEMKELGAFDS